MYNEYSENNIIIFYYYYTNDACNIIVKRPRRQRQRRRRRRPTGLLNLCLRKYFNNNFITRGFYAESNNVVDEEILKVNSVTAEATERSVDPRKRPQVVVREKGRISQKIVLENQQ
jgi:hypothetical protein